MSDNQIVLDKKTVQPNVNLEEIKVKKTKKDKLFEKEQEQTLNKLCNILEINLKEGNNCVTSIFIDEKQEEIMGLLDDIHKFFASKMWMDIKKTKLHPHMSIIRHIFKHHNYCILIKRFNDKKENTTNNYKYFIVKNQ
jgi:hypothetical protein